MTRSTRLFSMLATVTAAAPSLAAAPADFQKALESEKQVYVATQRADGSRSSAVPVWFWWDGTTFYFTTAPDSHKGKRLRRGSPLYVSVRGADGPFVEGKTEIINDLELVARMGEAYNHKYWIAWLGFFRPRPDRVHDGKTLAVKVTFP